MNKLNIIYAHGVHMGGGLSLLLDVVQEVCRDENYLMILDERVSEVFENVDLKNVKYFRPGIFGRLASEIYLKVSEQNINKVLSFNSIPFIMTYKFDVTIFFQNVNLLSVSKSVNNKYLIKRILFKLFIKRVGNLIVQSDNVARNIKQDLGSLITCEIITLLDQKASNSLLLENSEPLVKKRAAMKKTFIYPADGLPHKNHVNLLKGWELFKFQFPEIQIELILTIKGNNYKIFEKFDFTKLAITNVGSVSRDVVFSLYQKSDVLLFPSFSESLGLPLLEAKAMGLDIIASDVDYVFDVVTPAQVFDPHSSVSIARSIARYLGLCWPRGIRPMTASSFVEHVFG